jgi:Uma2 family endonuclease
MVTQFTPAALDIVPGQAGWPAQGQWTYEDYLRLPDDGNRYEIIEGVLYVTNAPNYDHQFTVIEIAYWVKQFVTENNFGVVLTAPFEVHLSPTTRPVQPDVLFIKADRQPASGAKFFEGLPDLIVEVLSPASIRTDRQIKLNIYEQAGVAEYWLADPKTRSVEVYTLWHGEYALLGQYTGAETVESKLLAGLAISVKTLFNS